MLIVAGTVSPAMGMAFTGNGMVTAAGNEGATGNLDSVVESDEATQLTDGSAALQRTWAKTLLLNLQNTETMGDYSAALDGVNQSLTTAVGPSVVANESAFTADATAVDSLTLTGSYQERKQTVLVAHLLASANNETASAQVSYAKWALNRTEDRLSAGGKRSAEAHIRNAERALDRGRERLSDGNATDLDSRMAAIEQSRVAWMQATLALERIEAETSPRVTITTRGDPLRNGTQELTGQIRGEVFDVRPRGLTNATVSVEDGPSVTVPVTVENRRANATFAANVTLEDRITSVTATVTETDDNRPGLGETDTETAMERQTTPATATDATADEEQKGGPGKAKGKHNDAGPPTDQPSATSPSEPPSTYAPPTRTTTVGRLSASSERTSTALSPATSTPVPSSI